MLLQKNIPYISKKDAMDSIKKEPEGKIIEKIKKMSRKQRIEQLEKFLIEIYINGILGENYA